VVLSDTDEKRWQTALAFAQSVLAGAIVAPAAAPDYEAKAPIRQEQRWLKKSEVETLIADYKSGLSTYHLSGKWGLNRHSVSKILARHGVEQRTYGASLTEAELTEAEALRRDGWSMNALARKYGISPQTLRKRLPESSR